MRTVITGTVRLALRLLLAALLGALMVAGAGLALYVRSLPELEVWHTADLDEEFSEEAGVDDLAGYLELEARLFEQLEREVYARSAAGPQGSVHRYRRGSHADPARWETDWNRTWEIPAEAPTAGVLMLHGLSDSPYSLRTLGGAIAGTGAWVLGLRVPGHGTAPAGLTRVGWQDMAAAVRLAVRHLRERVGDRPLHVVGYSNGGALAMEYALATLTDPDRPRLSRVVLISPEIGVSPIAALAVWQERLGRLLGVDRLAWQSLGIEYNPFKYQSFPINAGVLAHEITEHLRRTVLVHEADGSLGALPPILAFQSGVDATVSAPALISSLFAHLGDGDDELVLFDINRIAQVDGLLAYDPADTFTPLVDNTRRGYTLTVVSNASRESSSVVALTEPHGERRGTAAPLSASWPKDVYSLSHIALPFAPDDPLYGGPDAAPSPGVALGNLAPRGERGVLRISGGSLLRMSWNPFYRFLEQRTLDFLAEVP